MSPRSWSLHLVGDAKSRRADAARAVFAALHPEAVIRQSTNILAATAASIEGLEVLVLLESSPEDREVAWAALDARGLPRWAVIPPSFGEGPPADFGEEDWAPPMLARALSIAIALLRLRRDNARLSGDLNTVGRRLAHDLRTPLNSISTANEALEVAGIEPASEADLHRSIVTAVDEMCGLLARVGTVLVAGARPLDRQPIEMEEVVWSARESLDTVVRSAGAIIVAPAKWPVVNGVASLLELVWRNLLTNSVEHAGPAPRIELGWTRSDAHTRFWVRDSGAGVALAKRAQLFHPLDRLNDLNAPRGYGLSLVQRVIELHDGTTYYIPEPQPGGTFYFTLPEM